MGGAGLCALELVGWLQEGIMAPNRGHMQFGQHCRLHVCADGCGVPVADTVPVRPFDMAVQPHTL